MDLPVFRMVDADGATERAWDCSSMYYQLDKLITTAGYPKGKITIHKIRRGVANLVDHTNHICSA